MQTALTFFIRKKDRLWTLIPKLSSYLRIFYTAYPSASYPEILEKDNRPYNCLLIETHYDFYICLPYRTHVNHGYAFRFRRSLRSRSNRSGIDYSKMVIVRDQSYISNVPSTVDQDEYRETMQSINIIVNDAVAYLDDYIAYMNGSSDISQQEFNRKYGRSSLVYFNDILGINAHTEET